jgi:cytochrome c553
MTSSFPASYLKLCLIAVGFASLHAHAQDIKQQAGACAACHPMGNIAQESATPVIWGQNAGYIYVQLRDFKSGARAAASDAAMRALTQPMSDAEMLAMAKYVSAQSWPNLANTAPADALYQRGALVAALGDCAGCHFANWQGYSATPRLRGQTPAYLATTIEQFRSGERANAPGMADLLLILDAEDIKGLVAYLANTK